MNPSLIAGGVAFVLGLLCGFGPTSYYYRAEETKRVLAEQEAALAQERKNVRIVTQYQDLLSGVSDWYQRNPVRVRIQGGKNCTGSLAPSAEDIVLVVGGIKRGDSAAVGARLLGDNGTGRGAN